MYAFMQQKKSLSYLKQTCCTVKFYLKQKLKKKKMLHFFVEGAGDPQENAVLAFSMSTFDLGQMRDEIVVFYKVFFFVFVFLHVCERVCIKCQQL